MRPGAKAPPIFPRESVIFGARLDILEPRPSKAAPRGANAPRTRAPIGAIGPMIFPPIEEATPPIRETEGAIRAATVSKARPVVAAERITVVFKTPMPEASFPLAAVSAEPRRVPPKRVSKNPSETPVSSNRAAVTRLDIWPNAPVTSPGRFFRDPRLLAASGIPFAKSPIDPALLPSALSRPPKNPEICWKFFNPAPAASIAPKPPVTASSCPFKLLILVSPLLTESARRWIQPAALCAAGARFSPS